MAGALRAWLLVAALALLAPSALAQAECSSFWVAPSGDIAASAGAGETEIVVNAPVGCTFALSSDASWLSAYPDSFTATSTETAVAVIWEAATGTERSGSIAVQAANGETQFVTVRQSGSCAFTVDRASFSFDRSGGTGYFVVGTADACRWRVLMSWWLSTDPSVRAGPGLVEFSVHENLDPQEREGEFVVGAMRGDEFVGGGPTVRILQSATDDAPGAENRAGDEGSSTPPTGDSGDSWTEGDLVDVPGLAGPVSLGALATAALVVRRRTRRGSG